MSTLLRLPAALLAVALGAAACGSTGAAPASSTSPVPAVAPTPIPMATPTAPVDALTHPTGAHDVVLRFDEAGGFAPATFLAAHVPYFTLYGDGRVVFVSASAVVEPRADGVITGTPVKTATLGEDQVQALLAFALKEGGLSVARTQYPNDQVADAPTAVFEIHADGDSKTVSVVALGMDATPGPDTAIKTALRRLGDRLRDFDQGGAIGSAPYRPSAYRAILSDATGAQGVRFSPWPWADLRPSDFALPADQNALQMPTRTFTPDEAARIGVDGFEAGIVAGAYLTGPDGKLYDLALRPLLPDEER
jgi:hypothetical protein